MTVNRPVCLEAGFLGRMTVMTRPSRYPPELREHAVPMVAEAAPQYGTAYEIR